MLFIGHECLIQQLPIGGLEAGVPSPSLHCISSSTESRLTIAWPTVQHPLWSSDTTWIFHIYTVPEWWPDNANLSVRVGYLGRTRGHPSTCIAIRVPFPFSMGKHPYIKKLWWVRKLLHTGDQLCFPSLSACQYAMKDNTTTFSPSQAGLIEDNPFHEVCSVSSPVHHTTIQVMSTSTSCAKALNVVKQGMTKTP